MASIEDDAAAGISRRIRVERADRGWSLAEPAARGRAAPSLGRGRRIGHNGGPPLDDYRGPAWKGGDPHRFLHWKRAHAAAWKPKSRDVALFRLAKAEAIGLTYEEYTLELLERGRHLQAEDQTRIGEIKLKRRRRRGSGAPSRQLQALCSCRSGLD